MKLQLKLSIAVLLAATCGMAQADDHGEASVERGRYLVQITGCNDCHTPGYLVMNGDVPESEWLLGDSFGWHGPWGTTYGTNLRLYMSQYSEDEWVESAKMLKARPPMPWFGLNAMHEEDLRSIYRFVRTLEPLGEPAPEYLPPDQEPPMPHAVFPDPPPQN